MDLVVRSERVPSLRRFKFRLARNETDPGSDRPDRNDREDRNEHSPTPSHLSPSLSLSLSFGIGELKRKTSKEKTKHRLVRQTETEPDMAEPCLCYGDVIKKSNQSNNNKSNRWR